MLASSSLVEVGCDAKKGPCFLLCLLPSFRGQATGMFLLWDDGNHTRADRDGGYVWLVPVVVLFPQMCGILGCRGSATAAEQSEVIIPMMSRACPDRALTETCAALYTSSDRRQRDKSLRTSNLAILSLRDPVCGKAVGKGRGKVQVRWNCADAG